MTSKISDGDKLVASIKRTRSGDNSPAADESGPQASEAKPVRKKASRAALGKKKSTPRKASEIRERKAALVDLFQHGRRVWPD